MEGLRQTLRKSYANCLKKQLKISLKMFFCKASIYDFRIQC